MSVTIWRVLIFNTEIATNCYLHSGCASLQNQSLVTVGKVKDKAWPCGGDGGRWSL